MTKTQPNHKKLPIAKAHVELKYHFPEAVIPCHTPAQARAICRAAPFLQMTEGERIKAIASTIADDQRYDENTFLRGAFEADARAYLRARACLRAMGLGGGK